MNDRIYRPGDGTPVSAALELLNALSASVRAPQVTTRVWFGGHPAELELYDADGQPLSEVDDVVHLERPRAHDPELARALAEILAERLDDDEEE